MWGYNYQEPNGNNFTFDAYAQFRLVEQVETAIKNIAPLIEQVVKRTEILKHEYAKKDLNAFSRWWFHQSAAGANLSSSISNLKHLSYVLGERLKSFTELQSVLTTKPFMVTITDLAMQHVLTYSDAGRYSDVCETIANK